MPHLNTAQWTAIAVTVLVVLGSDMDIFYALPIGFLAGVLATLFSAFATGRLSLSVIGRVRLPAIFRRRPPQ